MRKVPMAKDGRTDREKIQDGYRQYRTLYPEVDEDEMYDNARWLWRRGFDPGLATAGILHKSALSIFHYCSLNSHRESPTNVSASFSFGVIRSLLGLLRNFACWERFDFHKPGLLHPYPTQCAYRLAASCG